MRNDGRARWFNDSKGFGYVEPKPVPIQRERCTMPAFDESDLRQWERTFNKNCGLI